MLALQTLKLSIGSSITFSFSEVENPEFNTSLTAIYVHMAVLPGVDAYFF